MIAFGCRLIKCGLQIRHKPIRKFPSGRSLDIETEIAVLFGRLPSSLKTGEFILLIRAQ